MSKGKPRNDCRGTAYEAQRVTDNLARLSVVTTIFIGLMLWFAALNLSAIFFGNRSYTHVPEYYFYYSGLLLLNVVVVIITRLAKLKSPFEPQAIRYYRLVNVIYIAMMLALSALISLVDLPNFGHAMVFIMSLLICSSFLLTTSKELLIAMAFPTAILLGGLPFYVDSYDILMKIYQELAAYIPISFAISRVLYKAYCENYKNRMRLEREVATNMILNRRLKQANHRLEELALVDELTGIANRRGLYAYIDKLLLKNGADFPFAAIMLDVDHFKDYNDYYGHSSGDEVLARVARVLREVANQTAGFICRWGGEEFLYVATDKDREGILNICKLIFDRIEQKKIEHPRSAISQYVSLSQGASSSIIKNRDDIIGTIQQADRALYKVKAGGRNNFIYKPYPGENATEEELAVGR